MQSIRSTNYFVHFQDEAYRSLGNYLNENSHSKVFILVDTNTEKYCLSGFLERAQFDLNYEVLHK